MTPVVQRVIEGTITAIIVYWLVTNASAFSSVATATQTAIVGSFKALSGR